jgi:repressor of nif and glnA expression
MFGKKEHDIISVLHESKFALTTMEIQKLIFKKRGVGSPGFRTIWVALNDLKISGFVIFRPVKNDKRAKGYWCLNPARRWF